MALSYYEYKPGESKALLFFKYIPSLVPTIVASAIFGICTLYFIFRIYRYKSPRFLYILALTGAMETVGFAIRAKCHYFTDLNNFLGMILLILLAPNLLALVNYKAVGEIIRLSNVQNAPFFMRPKFVTWFFFMSDILSFLLQGGGGALQAQQGRRELGRVITLIGLSIQLFFFASFAAITIYVDRSESYDYYVEGQPKAKKKLARCMYLTITLIYIRSIYRVAEYATGYSGPIARLEWAFYVFDAIMIFLCFIIYAILYPAHYLPKRDQKETLSENTIEAYTQDKV